MFGGTGVILCMVWVLSPVNGEVRLLCAIGWGRGFLCPVRSLGVCGQSSGFIMGMWSVQCGLWGYVVSPVHSLGVCWKYVGLSSDGCWLSVFYGNILLPGTDH